MRGFSMSPSSRRGYGPKAKALRRSGRATGSCSRRLAAGRRAEGAAAYRAALGMADNDAARAFLERRLADCEA
jgi:predicted RNA polymerase sigma factor